MQSQTKITTQVDAVDPNQWSDILRQFEESNILQSWGYGIARVGRSSLSHLVLKDSGQTLAAAQIRLAGLPRLRLGVAYIGWGPLWKSRNGEADPEIFRLMIRAIRKEYALRRGLIVRLVPAIWGEESEEYRKILLEEGYTTGASEKNFRTIIMDIRPSLEEIEAGFHKKWRKHLNRARKNNLEIIEGSSDELFDILGATYDEMQKRKGFSTPSDIHIYKRAQQDLNASEKMHIVLCKADGEVVSGALCSGLGPTGVDLFRATSNKGVTTYGSYLVQWKVVEYLKQRGCHRYNLNSVNPIKNPGGYQFKSQMGGKYGQDVSLIGAFDAYPNAAKKILFEGAERFIAARKQRREAVAADKGDSADSSPPQESAESAVVGDRQQEPSSSSLSGKTDCDKDIPREQLQGSR